MEFDYLIVQMKSASHTRLINRLKSKYFSFSSTFRVTLETRKVHANAYDDPETPVDNDHIDIVMH